MLLLIVLVSILVVLPITIWFFTVKMPGPAFAGMLPPLAPAQDELRGALARHVRVLAEEIGERSAHTYDAVNRAAEYVEREFRALGYDVNTQEYAVGRATYRNLEVSLRGRTRPEEIVVIGAHYDTAEGAPGADDNASGMAAVLELARALKNEPVERSVRFVAFCTEEPPYFPTANMGSRHYADAAAGRGDRIVGMLAIESIGYYATEPGTQRYPFPLNLAYPDRGDFIGFVSNLRSRRLLHRAIDTFRRHTQLPSQGAAAPWWVPGVWWSDHWAFWRHGYPAIMITDTAPYRNPFYHTRRDTPDKLDYARLARVVDGLGHVVLELARAR